MIERRQIHGGKLSSTAQYIGQVTSSQVGLAQKLPKMQ